MEDWGLLNSGRMFALYYKLTIQCQFRISQVDTKLTKSLSLSLYQLHTN